MILELVWILRILLSSHIFLVCRIEYQIVIYGYILGIITKACQLLLHHDLSHSSSNQSKYNVSFQTCGRFHGPLHQPLSKRFHHIQECITWLKKILDHISQMRKPLSYLLYLRVQRQNSINPQDKDPLLQLLSGKMHQA